jgi:hypothetical protein
MAVNPVAMMRAPMSRDPDPVNAVDPIARAVDVIRPVAHFDVDGDPVRDAAYCDGRE